MHNLTPEHVSALAALMDSDNDLEEAVAAGDADPDERNNARVALCAFVDERVRDGELSIEQAEQIIENNYYPEDL
jgi:hypothetical protein